MKGRKQLTDAQLVEIELIRSISVQIARFAQSMEKQDGEPLKSYFEGAISGLRIALSDIISKFDNVDLYRYAYDLVDGNNAYMRWACEGLNMIRDSIIDEYDDDQQDEVTAIVAKMFGKTFEQIESICEGIRCSKAGE